MKGSSMTYVRLLGDLSRADAPIAGEKAATLGELAGLGLPVPAGFCVTTNAFDDALDRAGLHEQAETLVAQAGDDAGALEEVSARLREAIAHISMPTDIASEIALAMDGLGLPVAVRSSATLEDTATATFAGQYDSYLNVLTVGGVIEKVRDCWASLWSPRALRYRRERALQGSGQMAVLVQRLMDPIASGVAFTEDVTSGRSDHMTVSAAFGLGEALVSGVVTPDLYIIEKATRQVLHRFAAYKERHAVTNPQGGIIEQMLPEERRQALSLTDAQLSSIVDLALEAEKNLGAAQDVEWAVNDDGVHLLQSRPVVKLGDSGDEVEWKSPVEGAKWRRNWRLGEWLADPVTPLFSTAMLPVLVAGREKQGLGHLGWEQPPSFAMPEPWLCIVNGYFYTRQDPPFGGPGPRTDPAERIRGMTERKPWLENWATVHLPAYIERLEEMKRFDLQAASHGAILDHLLELYLDAGEFWYLLAPIGFGFEEFFFKPVYERVTPEDSRPVMSSLFSGYGGKTLESQIELEEIAIQAASDDSIAALFRDLPSERVLEALEAAPGGPALRQRIERYLEEYGCQVFSLDFFFPTLGEQPDVTISAIRNYLTIPMQPVREKVASQEVVREQATRWVLDHVTGSPEDLQTMTALLGWHQTCARVREDGTFYFQSGWPLIRRALGELGRRLAETGLLRDREDIYFLELGELEVIARGLDQGRQLPKEVSEPVGRLRREWEARRKLSPPDKIPAADDPSWESSPFSRMPTGLDTDDEGRAVLRGQSASPGRRSGRARVIRSPQEFDRMRPGDILVAVATNPAWTPLFPLASAVVTETGGGATHSSLIAREYEIPCVMGTGVATQVIRDGQIITVDGSRGVVLLEE